MNRRPLEILVFCVLFLGPGWARSASLLPGQRCQLEGATFIYKAVDDRNEERRLPPKTQVELRSAHGARWLVQTAQGVLGYLDASALPATCRPQKHGDQQITTTTTPKLDAGDLTNVAEALEASKAAAEGVVIGQEVLNEQAALVEAAAQAREEARNATDPQPILVRVAVYDFDLTNVATGLGKLTTDALLAEVRKLEGVSAIGMDEVRELLDFEAQRQAMGCESDSACLAEIAGALGVDELLIGSLREEADGRSIVVKRVDQRRAEVRETFNQRLQIQAGEEFLLALEGAVSKLYPTRKNRPGTKRGVSEKVLLRVSPPPIPRWATITAFGATAVGFLAAYNFQAEADQRHREFLGAESGQFAATGDGFSALQMDIEAHDRLASRTLVGASLGLVASLVMSAFTDWIAPDESLDD